MDVLFDARRPTWYPEVGLSRYARSLLQALIDLEDPEINIIPIDLASGAWPSSIKLRGGHDVFHRLRQEQVDIKRLSRGADVLHLPWYEGPFRPSCPLVVTVHDLDTLDNPTGYSWRFRTYYNSLLRLYMRFASRIIVPSRATLAELEIRWPGRPYVCIPHGVASIFRQRGADEVSSTPTILYTGGYGPRKRIADLVTAFDVVAQTEVDARLIMTGVPRREEQEHVAKSAYAARIDTTGRVSDQRLAALYRQAWVLACPSDGEGFGLPLVEAFASGTPVVAYAGGAVDEVAGGAAVLIDRPDAGELASALLSVLRERELRQKLSRLGRERARHFDWSKAARRTLDVYRQACE